MRARPEVRDILIAHKMKYWSLRAQHPNLLPELPAVAGASQLPQAACQISAHRQAPFA
jgi:hypothetical protein